MRKFIKVYQQDKLITALIYQEKTNGNVGKTLHLFCEKQDKEELVRNLNDYSPLPFQMIDYTYFREKLLTDRIRHDTTVFTTISPLVTNVKNISVAFNRIIEQENKELERVKIEWHY